MLVTWRARRATIIRLVAPFVFLLLALIINLAINANNSAQERLQAAPTMEPQPIGGIPDCLEDMFIDDPNCLVFIYSPKGVPDVEVRGKACMLRAIVHAC